MTNYAQILKRQHKMQKQQPIQNGVSALPSQLNSNQMVLQLMSQYDGDAERLDSKAQVSDPDLLDKIKNRSYGRVSASQTATQSKRESNTGIPTHIKKKFEERSGFSYDDVQVHYNSDEPAELGALAYTQGNQVYIGPGQEEHLDHELGHVAQQKAGVVRATGSVEGMPMNDDKVVESAVKRNHNTNIISRFKVNPVIQFNGKNRKKKRDKKRTSPQKQVVNQQGNHCPYDSWINIVDNVYAPPKHEQTNNYRRFWVNGKTYHITIIGCYEKQVDNFDTTHVTCEDDGNHYHFDPVNMSDLGHKIFPTQKKRGRGWHMSLSNAPTEVISFIENYYATFVDGELYPEDEEDD